MDEGVIAYASVKRVPERGAGLVLTIWGCVCLPVGILMSSWFVEEFGSVIRLAWDSTGRTYHISVFELVVALLLLWWGVSDLNCGIALLRGMRPNLDAQIRRFTVIEILSYLEFAVPIIYLIGQVWSSGEYVFVAAVILVAHVGWLAALTVTRVTLQRTSDRYLTAGAGDGANIL